jgi:hypothetical protein
MAGAHDALQVRAQVPLGEIRGLAPLADHQKVGPRFEFLNGLDDVPVPELGGNLRDIGGLQARLRLIEEQASTLER